MTLIFTLKIKYSNTNLILIEATRYSFRYNTTGGPGLLRKVARQTLLQT